MQRKLKNIMRVATAIMVLITFSGNASDPQTSSSSGDAILMVKKEDTGRKRIPSCNFLELHYSDCTLTLLSDSYDGVFDLQFTNCENGTSLEIPSITVGSTIVTVIENGEYSVVAWDAEGRSFVGCLIIG